ncbi:MAG: hypothetical protein ACPGJE_05215, partial [Wenzhouxiangellaceae bacterium]
TLTGFTRDVEVIADAAAVMARGWARYQPRISIRLVGVGVSQLSAQPAAEELLQPGADTAVAPDRD